MLVVRAVRTPELDRLTTDAASGDRLDVEDQCDTTVTEQRRAGVDPERLDPGRDRLDHDLLGVQHPVDQQPEPLLVGLQDRDHAAARVARTQGGDLVGRHPEHLAEGDQREQLTAQAVDRSTPDVLDRRRRLLGVESDELEQVDLRHGEQLAEVLDRERRHDRERQRDPQPPGGAASDLRLDVDRPADGLDLRAHDVHADAAARHLRHGLRGREPRQEQQVEDLRRGHLRDLVRGPQPALDRLRRDVTGVDPTTVVGDLDEHLATGVVRTQRQGSLGRLVRGQTLLGGLDAVIDRVAHQVRQRVLDRLEEAAVELGVTADELEVHLPTALRGKVADDPGHLVPHVVDRLHASLHDPLLQLGGDQAQTLRGAQEVDVRGVLREPADLVTRQHELADLTHQPLEQLDVDPDRRLDGAAGHALILRGGVATPGCHDRSGARRCRPRVRRVRHRLRLRQDDVVSQGRGPGPRDGRDVVGTELHRGDRFHADRRPRVVVVHDGLRAQGRVRCGHLDRALDSRDRRARGGDPDALHDRPRPRGLEGGCLRRGGRLGCDGGLGRGGRLLDGRLGIGRAGLLHEADLVDHAVDGDVALGAVPVDAREDLPHRVDEPQQHVRHRTVHGPTAVAQLDEQVLARVGDLLEAAEREEPAGALDRVDRAEHAAQQLPRTRGSFERDKISVQLVEVLVALDQELADDVVQIFHSSLLFPCPVHGSCRAMHGRHPPSDRQGGAGSEEDGESGPQREVGGRGPVSGRLGERSWRRASTAPSSAVVASTFAAVTASMTSARFTLISRGASIPMRTPSLRTSMTVMTMSSPIRRRSPTRRLSTSMGRDYPL
ncbi:hypothetical protein GALL_352550 [mine drainage metagenome]|uniref:Uncharacterized protein n=1 Tax=mine drainage metagenome TaxID=410659 RepID=A0A1J5QSV2_9ZZZZ